jgi:hypothetical protein
MLGLPPMALRNHAAATARTSRGWAAALLLAAGCVFPLDLTPSCASSCNGCCDGEICVGPDRQSPSSCGMGGETCQACPTGNSCSSGQCLSSCGVCAGCCDGVFCSAGNAGYLCGSGGEVCQSCQSDQQCINQKCTSCTSANCAGCCNGFGECLLGTDDLECGMGGASCENCPGFTRCLGGTCQ